MSSLTYTGPVAARQDHLQRLIERDDVYDPSDPGLCPKAPSVIVAAPASPSGPFGLDAVRLLAVSCVALWAVVAVEAILLVR